MGIKGVSYPDYIFLFPLISLECFEGLGQCMSSIREVVTVFCIFDTPLNFDFIVGTAKAEVKSVKLGKPCHSQSELLCEHEITIKTSNL